MLKRLLLSVQDIVSWKASLTPRFLHRYDLVLTLLRLSGNWLEEESPPGTLGAASQGFELLSDPEDAGENTH